MIQRNNVPTIIIFVVITILLLEDLLTVYLPTLNNTNTSYVDYTQSIKYQ